MTNEEINEKIKEQINFKQLRNWVRAKKPMYDNDFIEDAIQDSFVWLLTEARELFEDALRKGYGPNAVFLSTIYRLNKDSQKGHKTEQVSIPISEYAKMEKEDYNRIASIAWNPEENTETVCSEKDLKSVNFKSLDGSSTTQLVKNGFGGITDLGRKPLCLDEYVDSALNFVASRDVLLKWCKENQDVKAAEWISNAPEYIQIPVLDNITAGHGRGYESIEVYYNALGKKIGYSRYCQLCLTQHLRNYVTKQEEKRDNRGRKREKYPSMESIEKWNKGLEEKTPNKYLDSEGNIKEFEEWDVEPPLVWAEWEEN